MSLKKLALKGVFWSALDRVINQLGMFVLLIYLSRELSPSDFGLIAMLTIFIALSQSLVDSGFFQALVHKSEDVKPIELDTVFFVNILLSLVVFSVLYILSPYIADFYQESELIDLSRVLFVIIVINSLSVVPRAILTINVDFKSQSIATVIATLVGAVVSICMVELGYGYWSIVGMNISNAIVSTVFMFKLSNWRPRMRFSYESFKELFNFGSNLMLAGVLSTIVQNLHSVVIGKSLGATQAGYYQQGANYTNKISFTLTSVVQKVTYPIMTSIKDDEERLLSVYTRVMQIIVFITFPILFGFAAVSNEFVNVFLGSKWEPIIAVLSILSISRVFYPINALNMNILNAKGRSDLFLKSDLMKVPFAFIFIYIALPYGLYAIVFSQLAFSIVSFCINTYYPGKLCGFGLKKQMREILPILLSSVVMYFAIAFIKFDNYISTLIVKILVGVLVYTTMSALFKIKPFYYFLRIFKGL